MGAIAAAVSREDKLGYIADQHLWDSCRYQRFAMGARMINLM